MEDLIQILELMGRVASRPQTKYNIEILQHITAAMICEVLSHYEEEVVYDPSKFTRKEVYYADFLELIFNHYHEEHTVDFYARKLLHHLSLPQLNLEGILRRDGSKVYQWTAPLHSEDVPNRLQPIDTADRRCIALC